MDDKDKNQTEADAAANAAADASAEAEAAGNGQHSEAAEATEETSPEQADAPSPDAGAAPETVETMREQLLRALADAENVRRRAKKDVQDAGQYAISNFARDLLSVADNMSRALSAIPAESRAENEALAAIADGVEMTARELEAVFERHRIKPIDPMGERFDYNLHQAMFENTETDQPDGTVVQVLQVGYMIGERLLRPAMVGVAKGGGAASDAGSVEETDDQRGNKLDTTA